MIYGPNYGYEAIQSVSKKKSANNRIIAYGLISLLFTSLSVYFLYSGYYGLSTPLSHLLRMGPRSSPKTNIRIEYYMDDLTEPIKPGTKAWTAFHDELIEEAGYNPNDLRKNPYATVSFVAYDAIEEDLNTDAKKKNSKKGKKSSKTKKKKSAASMSPSTTATTSSPQQDRPAYGLTCYTEYNDIGSVNSKS